MKLINFRKIGTVLAIAVFGFISFTAGVDLTQNANSVGSNSVLPVVKGGTGNNIGKAVSADKLYTARNISDIPFDGTKDIDLPGVTNILNVNSNGVSPIYIQFSKAMGAWTLADTLNIYGGACPHRAFFITYSQKTNEEPLIKDLKYSIQPPAISQECINYAYDWTNDGTTGNFYIRIHDIQNNINRPILWQSESGYVTAKQILDSETIAVLEKKQWYYFDRIQGTTQSPVPTPTEMSTP